MKKNYVKFGKEIYFVNLEKLKEICLTSSKEGSKEIQIAQTYEVDENDELNIVSKVEHETKSFNNAQNDMIVYDIVKIFLVSLLENNETEDVYKLTFGSALAINTLINWGILEKIN